MTDLDARPRRVRWASSTRRHRSALRAGTRAARGRPPSTWPPGPRRRLAGPLRPRQGERRGLGPPALLALLVATAVLYLWDLGASGWANSFYSAAVQAGTKSWKAFFFGSSDSSNFITVDKPPAFLWPMEISARIFGLNSWSMLVPQALEGVATVGLVYLSVRRWFSAQAALLGGAVVALTPVAAMMFRYNNPDALLALLLTAATYATMRGLERAQTKWLVLAGALVGFGFITKMMQAFLILPVMAVVYLLAAPTGWWRRVWQTFLMGVSVLVAAGWWVAVVALTPAADRPYVGGSQNNSILNLIFGYNGFGRLTGNETGSVGGGRCRREHVGPDRAHPALQRRVRQHDVVAAARRARDGRRPARRHASGPVAPTASVPRSCSGAARSSASASSSAWPRASSTPTTPSPWRRRSARSSASPPWACGSAAPPGSGASAWPPGWPRRWCGATSSSAAPPTGSRRCVPSWPWWARSASWPSSPSRCCARVPKLAIALVAVLGLGAALAAPLFSTVATAATPAQRRHPVGDADAGRRLRRSRRGGFPGGGGFPARSAVPAAPSAAAAFPGGAAAAASPAAGFPAASRAAAPAPAAAPARRSPAARRPFGAGRVRRRRCRRRRWRAAQGS